MSRKPVRFGLLIVGLLITAALAYRAVDDEASLGRAYHERLAHDRAAGDAVEALADLRSSLHAYVAPGQGLPFWSNRSTELLDMVRERLITLDAAVEPMGGSLAEALDAVDQLAAAERRARESVSRGESLVAGDVLFTEVRDLLAASLERIHTARMTLAAAHDRRISELRNEQAMLAGGGLALWLVIALLLANPVTIETVKDPNAWRNELAETIKKPIQKDTPTAPLAPPAPVAPLAPSEPSVSVSTLRSISEICADLSTLSDTGALSGALDRAAALLDASGVIVWVASNDGGSLSPVASQGFDQKLVSRIGRIARDAANLTALAYRENGARVSAATATAPAALAVSLCGPSGPLGVLSVELKPGFPADEGRVMMASIFAAQLATLASPLPSVPSASVPSVPSSVPSVPSVESASVPSVERVEEPQRAAL